MFRNIAVIALKEPRLLKLINLTAKTFPSATYHLISVIPTHKSRPIPSTIVMDIHHEMSRDTLSSINVMLRKLNVLNIKEVRLYGSLKAELTKYLVSKRIDLTVHVVTPGEKPGEALPIDIGKVLKSSGTSFLLHASPIEDIPEGIEKALVVVSKTPWSTTEKVSKLLKYLRVKASLKAVTLLCSEESFCKPIIDLLEKGMTDLPTEIVVEAEWNISDLLRKHSRNVDLVIECREILRKRQLLSNLQIRTVNALKHSNAPILLL